MPAPAWIARTACVTKAFAPQGGPGASSTGYGNFQARLAMLLRPPAVIMSAFGGLRLCWLLHAVQEIGPFGVGWTPRKHSWVEKASLLFVDNPVCRCRKC